MAKQKPKAARPCIRREVKLKLTKAQEELLELWLWQLTAVYNWGIRKIELNAANKIYFTKLDFINLLAGTPQKLGIPGQVIQGVLERAWMSWDRCFKKTSKKPRLKGKRRPLTSMTFPANCQIPEPGVLKIRGFMGGKRAQPVLRYKQQHAQAKHDPQRRDMIDQIPKNLLGSVVLKKKASGWYASILVHQAPNIIPRKGFGVVGIDPGFDTLLTFSSGEKVEHPKEFQQGLGRITQAARGKNRELLGRLHEKMARQVRDRNHKLSRKTISENILICYSQDNLLSLAEKKKGKFGKSVRAAGHGQLRDLLWSKSLNGGTKMILVDSHKSTMTCCICKAETGPRGRAGLKVRYWQCSNCGVWHDRDISSAVHTISIGAGQALEPKEIEKIKQYYLSEICPKVKELILSHPNGIVSKPTLTGVEPTKSNAFGDRFMGPNI